MHGEKKNVVVSPKKHRPAVRAFKDSLIVEILNPKSALFYFAFLPQFTTADASSPPLWLQIILLGVIANVMFSLSDLVCILATAAAARFVALRVSASTLAAQWVRRMGGGILIAMGARIAAEPS